MEAGVAVALAQLATDAQPDPVPVGVLHAESLVDVIDLAANQLVGNREEVDVVGLHQCVDLAEGEEIAAAAEAKHREHRLRPKNSAARKIPVPQAAAAAIERGVD